MIGSPHTRTISFGDGVCAAQKMALQLLFRALAISLQGLFFNPECSHGLGAKIRSGVKNLSKSYFIWGSRRKKFPNSNPDSGSAPKPLNSRNFPPAISRSQTRLPNINRKFEKNFPKGFLPAGIGKFFSPHMQQGAETANLPPRIYGKSRRIAVFRYIRIAAVLGFSRNGVYPFPCPSEIKKRAPRMGLPLCFGAGCPARIFPIGILALSRRRRRF